jgi:hypothetical protein
MNKYIIIIIYVFITSCSGNGKVVNKPGTLEQVISFNASEWTKSFKNSDLKLLFQYTYKADLKGKSFDEFVSENTPSIRVMKVDAVIVDSFTLSEPSRIVECNGEMQSVLKRALYMSRKGDPFVVKSKIVGISDDKGITWTFINVGSNSIKDLKKLYPNICDNLPIEE